MYVRFMKYKVCHSKGKMNVSTENDVLDVTLDRQQSNRSSMADANETLHVFVMRHPSAPLDWYGIMNIVILSVILFGSTLNMLILLFIRYCKKMQTPFNMIISVILLGNLLRSGIVIVMEIVETYNNYSIQGKVYCILKVLLRGSTYGLSLVTITAIAVMRAYICIKTVVIKLKMSAALTVIIIAFLLSMILVAPYLLPGSTSQNICLVNFPLGGDDSHRFYPAIRGPQWPSG